MKRVAFIMVNHNGGDEVLQSARSVTADLAPEDTLVLVDNGSSDGSGEMVKQEIQEVVLLQHDDNLPFAAANNRGIKWALDEGYSYIGIINPDVRVRPGMTDNLIERLKTGGLKTGAASPVMLYENPPDTIWFAGGRIWWLFAWVSHRGQGRKAVEADRFAGKTDYLTGCCWLAPASTWRETGPMDDRYGMYGEDVDWSWRARKKGLSLEIEPSAVLIHRLSQSSGGGRNAFKIKHWTLAARFFFRRHTPRALRIPQAVLKLLPIKLYALMLAFKGEWAAVRTFLSANLQPLGDRIQWPPSK